MAKVRSDTDAEREARAQIAQTEEAEAQDRAAKAASLFDLRWVIGGLLTLYGAVLTVMGVVASSATKTKAAGININLWAGLAMLACGGFFLAWGALRPLRAEQVVEEAEPDRPSVEVER
jgi:cation transport ATPase